MTAITTSQLDEIERKAKAYDKACAAYVNNSHLLDGDVAAEQQRELAADKASDEYREALTSDVALQLVAIARAALDVAQVLQARRMCLLGEPVADRLLAALRGPETP